MASSIESNDTAGSSNRFRADGSGTLDSVANPGRKDHGRIADGTGDQSTTASVRFEPRSSVRQKSGTIDRRLLDRAAEILEHVENVSPESMTLSIESLRSIVSQLWESAAGATQFHHSILALIEGALNAAEKITPGLAAALRGATRDLRNPVLTETYAEIIRSQFIDEGYNPLAIISNWNNQESEADAGNEQTESGGAPSSR